MSTINSKKLEAACIIAYNACAALGQCLGKEVRPDWGHAEAFIRHQYMADARHVFEGKAVGDPEKLHEFRFTELKKHKWSYGRKLDIETKRHPLCIEWDKLDDGLKKETAMFIITIGSIRNVFGWTA